MYDCVDVSLRWLAEEFHAAYASGGHIYTPYYCEENIHELSRIYLNLLSEKKCLLQRHTSGHVMYISTEDRKTPMWHQKLCNDKAEVPVIWDYHVVFVIRILRSTTKGEEATTLPIEYSYKPEEAPMLRQDSYGAFASVVIDFDTSIADKGALFPGLIDLNHYLKLSFRANSFKQ